jgi:SAM-dependent methyltransferase
MLKWFRRSESKHQTALAMIGPKPGDRVLVGGQPAPALVAELARATGLNGQTTAACAAEARHAVESAAATAGALVEVRDLAPHSRSPLPPGMTDMDIVVLVVDFGSVNLEARLQAVGDAMSALRPGGRFILLDGHRGRRLFGSGGPPAMPADVVVPMLVSVGAIAARALGVADDVTFYEARKAR